MDLLATYGEDDEAGVAPESPTMQEAQPRLNMAVSAAPQVRIPAQPACV